MFLFIKNNVRCYQCNAEGDSKNKLGLLALFFLLVILAAGAYFFSPRGYLGFRSILSAATLLGAAVYVGARRDAHLCRYCGSEWVSEK